MSETNEKNIDVDNLTRRAAIIYIGWSDFAEALGLPEGTTILFCRDDECVNGVAIGVLHRDLPRVMDGCKYPVLLSQFENRIVRTEFEARRVMVDWGFPKMDRVSPTRR